MRLRTRIALLMTTEDEVHWTITVPTSVSFDWRGTETTVRYGLTSGCGSNINDVTCTQGSVMDSFVIGPPAGVRFGRIVVEGQTLSRRFVMR